MGLYGWTIGPFARLLNPETAHRLAIGALKRHLVPASNIYTDQILESDLWGLKFPNPVGLAAGFDKNADLPDAILRQGFGFAEVGTVTPKPQIGNPKPRLFRLRPDQAVINRLGFNNDGLEAMSARLRDYRESSPAGIVGANIGMNRDSEDALADYASCVSALAAISDYLVVNVSSPNTPGLRGLQGRDELPRLLRAVQAARAKVDEGENVPILIKIAPDLTESEIADIAAVALEAGIDGMLATNTTISRPTGLVAKNRGQEGGLSGRPLFEMSTKVLSDFYRATGGKIPMIGVGGISSGKDAYVKIKAGASLVQLYTALIYHGPSLAGQINRDLAALLREDGYSKLSDAVGADHRN